MFVLIFGFKITADGDWTELDAVEGGWGGIYTSWTNIASVAANITYSAWTTKLSYCDGQSQNNAENYVTASVYYNAVAADSIFVVVQAKTYSDNLVTVVDTLGYFAGATTPAALNAKVSLSNYGRQYRVKITPYTSGDGDANASTNDVEISFYCAKPDVINPHKAYNTRWEGGGLPGRLESVPVPFE